MDRFNINAYKCWCCGSDYEGANIETNKLPWYVTKELDESYNNDACPVCAAPQPKREEGWYEFTINDVKTLPLF